jgi:hypothetical protein
MVINENSNEEGPGRVKGGEELRQRLRGLGEVLSGFQNKLGTKGSSGKGRRISMG